MSASWLIAAAVLPAQTLTINGNPFVVSADERYVYDPTAADSWLDALRAALVAASVTTPAVFLTQSRRVRITAGSTFTLVWTSTAIRDLLGFTGTLSSVSAATAEGVSPALWSPGYRMTPRSIAGVDGIRVPDTRIFRSPTGLTATFIEHYAQTHQELSASVVPIERVWTPSLAGGEYERWWREYATQGRHIVHYEGVDEGSSTTTAATLSGIRRGPYKLRDIDPQWYQRVIDNTDRLANIALSLVKVSAL